MAQLNSTNLEVGRAIVIHEPPTVLFIRAICETNRPFPVWARGPSTSHCSQTLLVAVGVDWLTLRIVGCAMVAHRACGCSVVAAIDLPHRAVYKVITMAG